MQVTAHLRPSSAGIFRQLRYIAPARQGHDIIILRVARDQINRTLPDRPGRAKNRNRLQKATPGHVKQPATSNMNKRRTQQRIKAVKQPAMPGDQGRAVLDPIRRLSALSAISPIWPAKLNTIDISTIIMPASVNSVKTRPTMPAPIQPATVPLHVFLG